MKCIVVKRCWPDADTVWEPGLIVDVTPAQYALLENDLKKMAKIKPVEKVREAYEAPRK